MELVSDRGDEGKSACGRQHEYVPGAQIFHQGADAGEINLLGWHHETLFAGEAKNERHQLTTTTTPQPQPIFAAGAEGTDANLYKSKKKIII